LKAKSAIIIIKLNLETLIMLFTIVLILCPKTFKKMLKKIAKKNSALKKVIFFNIFIVNKTFSPIYDTQIKKSFNIIFSRTLRSASDAG